MRIALINGSPKTKNSASGCILQALKGLLPDEHEITEYSLRKSKISASDLEQISESSVLVFSFPLYVDGIPSQLLNCLYQMEMFFKAKAVKTMTVYSLVNSGFYEGEQNAIALEMIKNWCVKAGVDWGQGLGIGGGGMYPAMAAVPDGQGPKKNLQKALRIIAENLSAGAAAENIYINPGFPRILYKLAAEMGWRQQIKANGLKRKDLFTKK